jgi:hypothetical protein
LLVLDSHAERGKGRRAAELGVFIEEDCDFVWISGSLQDDGAKLAERTN